MKPLDAKTLRRFVELASSRLSGDWVLLGGAVLPLLGVDYRSTVDIDLSGPDEAGMDQTLILMEIAQTLGLPVESINQAGAFFLRRIRGWRPHLVELRRGTGATIFLPDPTLFLLLKVRRLTESDLADCQEMLKLARRNRKPLDVRRVLRSIERERKGASTAKQDRLDELAARLRGN